MFPHALIHLKLAQTRHDELVEEASFARRLLRGDAHAQSRTTVHFAHRETDGLTVDLYWTHGDLDDTFRIEVVDRVANTEFTLRPANGKEAVNAYHHPFVALARGLGSTGGLTGASAKARP
jgi:hypothetical protein